MSHEDVQIECCKQVLCGSAPWEVARRIGVSTETVKLFVYGSVSKKLHRRAYLNRIIRKAKELIEAGENDKSILKTISISPPLLEAIRLQMKGVGKYDAAVNRLPFKIGDRVSILQGMYRGLIGRVKRIAIIDPDTDHQFVELSIDGHKNCYAPTGWCNKI